MPEKPTLSPDAILVAEFEYITQAATQTNEDRARVTSFYLVTFASFIAALVSIQFDLTAAQVQWVNGGFAGLFAALALMGWLTIIQLARLRMAWFDSVQALNQIKAYYAENLPGAKLAYAFRWSDKTLPPRLKVNTLAFVMMLEVALIGGIAAGACFFFTRAALGLVDGIPGAIVAGIGFALAQIGLYAWMLRDKPQPAKRGKAA